MKKIITIKKEQKIVNDVAGPIEYWIDASTGIYSHGFSVNEDEARILLEKLKEALEPK